jgi:hypothetical protein
MALYLFDSAGGKELLYQDPEISCGEPMPVRPRAVPPILASQIEPEPASEGRFLLADVYQGLEGVEPGEVTALRVVAVPAKTHPTMNFPMMGITADDPGKCVLGTVPVEQDGSAYFCAPAGVTLFFQALDRRGMAIQSMRSATHVQPGQTVSCIGCHEPRTVAPPVKRALASFREPSRIKAGPDGSWPIHFGRLVQPVLDRQCASCHSPGSKDVEAAKFDLSAARAYQSLVDYGKPSLRDQVMTAYRQGYSVPGEGIAHRSALRALLDAPKGHYDVALTPEDRNRLFIWMDTYAQKLGAFSPEQEAELERLRLSWTAAAE